jgi:hypothetical protein
MPDVDIAWLVKELDSLGLKLSATRRMDGSFGLSKWRAMNYWGNAPQAEALWKEHVGDKADVVTAIAEFVGRPNLEIFNAPSITPAQRFTSPQ